jgi:7-keto-8-aminopelargonate synthetase-like enzyme
MMSEKSPIIPIKIGEDFRVLHAWKTMWNRGIFCNPVLTPAVAKGQGILRFSVMRSHSYSQIDQVVETCNKFLKPIIENKIV